MAIWDTYISNAPVAESEQPSDNIEEGKYPLKSINASVKHVEGTNDKGPYEFTDVRIQWQVTAGPMKGQATWMRANITAPDPDGLDEGQVKRFTYFTQHFLDATGLGKRLDSNWSRSEKPHPTKPNKTITTFKGRMLTRAALNEIAKNEASAEEFAKVLVGLTCVCKVGMREYTRKDGTEGEENTMKSVEPLNDATLNAVLSDASANGSASASPSASPYSKTAN